MSEYDDIETQIDTLHGEAEDLADQARASLAAGLHAQAGGLRRQAARKVRTAARLRTQIGGE